MTRFLEQVRESFAKTDDTAAGEQHEKTVGIFAI
jgi:hypothetical protein